MIGSGTRPRAASAVGLALITALLMNCYNATAAIQER